MKFKIISLLFFVISSIIFTGCINANVKTIEKPVYIPTMCEVKMPIRPHTDKIDAEYLRKVLIYTDTLECDLHFCIYGEIKSECSVEKQ